MGNINILQNSKMINSGEALKCGCCGTFFKTGVFLTECTHIFCQKCIKKLFKKTNMFKCSTRTGHKMCQNMVIQNTIKKISDIDEYYSQITGSFPAEKKKMVEEYIPPTQNDQSTNNGRHSTRGKTESTSNTFNVAPDEQFECGHCQVSFNIRTGVFLTECKHIFCQNCIKMLFENATVFECSVKTEHKTCQKLVMQNTIKIITTIDEYFSQITGSFPDDDITAIQYEQLTNNVNEELWVETRGKEESTSNKYCISPEGSEQSTNIERDSTRDNKEFTSNAFDLPPDDAFRCELCRNSFSFRTGVFLTECKHTFCKKCIEILSNPYNSFTRLVESDYKRCQKLVNGTSIKEIYNIDEYYSQITGSSPAEDIPAIQYEQMNNDVHEGSWVETRGNEESTSNKYCVSTDRNVQSTNIDRDSTQDNNESTSNDFDIPPDEAFRCEYCEASFRISAGVFLTECKHTYCKNCIEKLCKYDPYGFFRCFCKTDNKRCLKFVIRNKIKEINDIFDYYSQTSPAFPAIDSTHRNEEFTGNEYYGSAGRNEQLTNNTSHSTRGNEEFTSNEYYGSTGRTQQSTNTEHNSTRDSAEFTSNEYYGSAGRNKQSNNNKRYSTRGNEGFISNEYYGSAGRNKQSNNNEHNSTRGNEEYTSKENIFSTALNEDSKTKEPSYNSENQAPEKSSSSAEDVKLLKNKREEPMSHEVKYYQDATRCRNPECKVWLYYGEEQSSKKFFTCPDCKQRNCFLCKGLHNPEAINCAEYKKTLKNASELSVDLLKNMLENNEAMLCPNCKETLLKDDGCDFITCFWCKVELCWVTRGYRWGPGGPGDISGGCRCQVDGIKCHPNCGTCH